MIPCLQKLWPLQNLNSWEWTKIQRSNKCVKRSKFIIKRFAVDYIFHLGSYRQHVLLQRFYIFNGSWRSSDNVNAKFKRLHHVPKTVANHRNKCVIVFVAKKIIRLNYKVLSVVKIALTAHNRIVLECAKPVGWLSALEMRFSNFLMITSCFRFYLFCHSQFCPAFSMFLFIGYKPNARIHSGSPMPWIIWRKRSPQHVMHRRFLREFDDVLKMDIIWPSAMVHKLGCHVADWWPFLTEFWKKKFIASVSQNL